MMIIIIIIDIRWRYFDRGDACTPDESTTPVSSLTPRSLTAELRDASQDYMRYQDDIEEGPVLPSIRPSEVLAAMTPPAVHEIQTYQTTVVNQTPVCPTPAARDMPPNM